MKLIWVAVFACFLNLKQYCHGWIDGWIDGLVDRQNKRLVSESELLHVIGFSIAVKKCILS